LEKIHSNKASIGYPPTVKELQTIGKKLPQDAINLKASLLWSDE